MHWLRSSKWYFYTIPILCGDQIHPSLLSMTFPSHLYFSLVVTFSSLALVRMWITFPRLLHLNPQSWAGDVIWGACGTHRKGFLTRREGSLEESLGDFISWLHFLFTFSLLAVDTLWLANLWFLLYAFSSSGHVLSMM